MSHCADLGRRPGFFGEGGIELGGPRPAVRKERAQCLVSTFELAGHPLKAAQGVAALPSGTWPGQVQAEAHSYALHVFARGLQGGVCSVRIAVLGNEIQEGLKVYASPISKIPAVSCNIFRFFSAA